MTTHYVDYWKIKDKAAELVKEMLPDVVRPSDIDRYGLDGAGVGMAVDHDGETYIVTVQLAQRVTSHDRLIGYCARFEASYPRP
jgi:hypothetical protein